MLHQSPTIDNYEKVVKLLIEQNRHLRQLANIAFFFLIVFLIGVVITAFALTH